jgi:hypothetical protein
MPRMCSMFLHTNTGHTSVHKYTRANQFNCTKVYLANMHLVAMVVVACVLELAQADMPAPPQFRGLWTYSRQRMVTLHREKEKVVKCGE